MSEDNTGAVQRGAERGAAAGDGVEPGLQQRRRDLRRVHADQEGGAAHVGERGREPGGEAVAALRDDLEGVGDPRPRLAVEDDHAPDVAIDGQRGRERVLDRGGRQPRRLGGRAGWGESRLHAPGDGRLGDDHEGGGHDVYARQARNRFTAGRRPCRAPRGRCRAACR